MRGLSTPARLPKLPKPPKVPQPPRFVPQAGEPVGGPGQSPPGFLTGQNSLTEWYVYWGFARIFTNPKDPRVGPFYGGFPDWGYQVAEIGGHTRALGSAVVDFVAYQGREILGIRVQTEHFHIYADARKQAYDELQRATLESSGLRVIDIYDSQILGDPSGQKCILALKQILNRIELIDPDIAMTAIRGSRLRPLR
jgi:hypothetical protein